MAFISSNMVRWSPFNLPGPTLYGYETSDSIASVSVNTYFSDLDFFVTGIDFSVGDNISASCSDGGLLLTVTSINPVLTTVDFAEVGPNTVYTAAIQNGAVTRPKTTGLAYSDLSNLSGVATNTGLVGDTDNAYDLGTVAHRWRNLYATALNAGTTNAQTLILNAYNTGGLVNVPFVTLTSGASPSCVLASGVTASTQSPGDNTTKLATTAFVQAAVVGGTYANEQLSNLSAVAINASLVAATDVTSDLGTYSIRWNNLFAANIGTDHTAGHTTTFSAWNVMGGSFTTFITLTANNTPTCVLSSAVTGTTQSPSTNNTTLATTAYVDTAINGIGSVLTLGKMYPLTFGGFSN